MRKKIKNSLSVKVFLWVFSALAICSMLIYGIVLTVLPKQYQVTSDRQLDTNTEILVSKLQDVRYDEAVNEIYNFCIHNNSAAILSDDNTALSFGEIKAEEQLIATTSSIAANKIYAILGPSGCGKTTLLSLLGGLDSPSDGQVLFQEEDIEKRGLAWHRKNNVAFIFQSYNLIDYMTPAENVALTSKLPLLPILERLGLTKEESKRNVLKLSGGQQQRVAIARALASDASVILADEPTGNLDEDTAVEITNLLKECAHQMNKCVIIVTHSNELAKQADVVLRLKKSELQQL